VLPISNPANLVVFDGQVLPLPQWLERFALPSALSIVATFVMLRLTQRDALLRTIAADVPMPRLTLAGRLSAIGIGATAAVLLAANATGRSLGAPTFAAGVVTAAIVLLRSRQSPWPIVRGVHWAVLPLVASLFVLVEGLQRTGLLQMLSAALDGYAQQAAHRAGWWAGSTVAVSSNVLNNLPVALIARYTMAGMPNNPALSSALLIGVDLGPNLAVTGSLATILWLSALRREGQHISAAAFLRLGMLIMPPALLLALASTLLL
jgi:arsenical pump membrane protein